MAERRVQSSPVQSSDECRILTNVRCLSEGVDVPSLDAVMFLSARNSQVDVVQSVGRVMRRAPNKKYGYIIIPVVVPSDLPPEKVLDKTGDFKVVWSVLNALRAHDDRFNATINKIDLNKKRPINILVGGIPHPEGKEGERSVSIDKMIQTHLQLQFGELQNTIYARMVEKVGDRQYWEHWATKVAEIAQTQVVQIRELVKNNEVRDAFVEFVESLREIINPTIDEEQAIEMLSQHMITRPVFEALFENYSFAAHNPVSQSMQRMIAILEENAFLKETEPLEKFYKSVQETAKGLDNAEARQKVIVKLYDNFFKTAFPRMVQRLGIVYTPVEVVDFIVHSADEVLKREFGRGLTDENVHILDPFTGTGTFVTRLLQNGLIDQKDLVRKYREEIHANEIVLLAYYIAAINIENTFHSLMPEETSYQAFPGICLTDTFQMNEFDEREHLASEFFPQNSERMKSQKNTPITVIIGNPPYSTGQRSANDNAQNLSYPKLEEQIATTYVKDSAMTNKSALYDSYIKAFRWAKDRLEKTHVGIIGFVSNGGWIDGNAMDGFRKHLERDFSRIYVLNLRGNARTQGELRRKEAGNVFDSGSRTSVAITLLVKKPANEQQKKKAVIFYYDIGDYLSREQKLDKLKKFQSVCSKDIPWSILHPNAEGDWINQRNQVFATYSPIGDKMGEESDKAYFISIYSRGVGTFRDAWCYNSSRTALCKNIQKSIVFYNSQVDDFKKEKLRNSHAVVDDIIIYNSTEFSWSYGKKKDLKNLKKYHLDEECMQISMYRPFFKQYLYFNRDLNDAVCLIPKLFPTPQTQNRVICVSAPGTAKDFSLLIVDCIPDLHIIGDSQCFPLYYYENSVTRKGKNPGTTQVYLFTDLKSSSEEEYPRKDGISDFILEKAKMQYQTTEITKEDIFYYVYGFLHSKEYRKTFANDLKKMLARIPLVPKKEDFLAFSRAGRNLADLHLHYEDVEPYPADISGTEFENFRVNKMKFITKGDRSRIQYNGSIVISGIPDKAYEYLVNGKSAIEWIMERYQVTIDKDSGIKNDPNEWAEERGEPRYILDLLLRIITVSIQTMKIVDRLP